MQCINRTTYALNYIKHAPLRHIDNAHNQNAHIDSTLSYPSYATGLTWKAHAGVLQFSLEQPYHTIGLMLRQSL